MTNPTSLDQALELVSALQPQNRGGAPAGNLNAVKHGRRSRRVRQTRAVIRAIELSLDTSTTSDPDQYAHLYTRAVRWSRDELAALQIAVLKHATIVRWHIATVDAFAAQQPPPDPPASIPSRREAALFTVYVQQRRLLINSRQRHTDIGLDVPGGQLVASIMLATHSLSDWELASAILTPELLEASAIDVEATRDHLRDISRTAIPLLPDSIVAPQVKAKLAALPPRREQQGARVEAPANDPLAIVHARARRGKATNNHTTFQPFDESGNPSLEAEE